MARKYLFSKEEIAAIEKVRKENKDKRAELRLKALELRAKGATAQEVADQTGFYPTTITRLVAKYRKGGIEAISGNIDFLAFGRKDADVLRFENADIAGELLELL